MIDDWFFLQSVPLASPTSRRTIPLPTAAPRPPMQLSSSPGSTDKDYVYDLCGASVRAEVDSRIGLAQSGLTTVGAPLERRISLSALSLHTARLPFISGTLATMLSGSWTSVFGPLEWDFRLEVRTAGSHSPADQCSGK